MSDDDIVDTLERQYARTGLKFMLNAANEIERLRAALADALTQIAQLRGEYEAPTE